MAALNPENTPEQTPEPVQAPEPITDEKKREKLNIAMGNLSKEEMTYLINLLDMQPLPQEKKKHFFYSVNKVLVLIKNGKFPIIETDKKGKKKTILLKNYKGITLRERIMIRNNIANLFLDTADPDFRNPFYYNYTDGKKTLSLLMTNKSQIISRIMHIVTDQKRLQMIILHNFRNLIEPFRGFHFDRSNKTHKRGGRRKRRKQKKKTKRRKTKRKRKK
jgi:hypothetical protein